MVQLSHPCMTAGQIIVLTILTFVGKVMSLLFNVLSRSVRSVWCECSLAQNHNVILSRLLTDNNAAAENGSKYSLLTQFLWVLSSGWAPLCGCGLESFRLSHWVELQSSWGWSISPQRSTLWGWQEGFLLDVSKRFPFLCAMWTCSQVDLRALPHGECLSAEVRSLPRCLVCI